MVAEFLLCFALAARTSAIIAQRSFSRSEAFSSGRRSRPPTMLPRLECEYTPLAHCLPCLVDGASPHRLDFLSSRCPRPLQIHRRSRWSLAAGHGRIYLQPADLRPCQLLGEGGWIFNRTRSFYGWNIAVLAYVALMSAAGWREALTQHLPLFPARRATLFTFFA